MSKPIAITVGDPAGIGPEVVLKTLLKTRSMTSLGLGRGALELQRSARRSHSTACRRYHKVV